MKNRRVLVAVIVLVVVVLAVGGIFFYVSSSQKATVKVAKVTSEPLSVVVSASGQGVRRPQVRRLPAHAGHAWRACAPPTASS